MMLFSDVLNNVKIMDTEVAQVLSDRLRYFGFELMKELWKWL